MNEKVALYFRVSTKSQDVEMQLIELRRYCASRGFKIYKEYLDVGSGSRNDRESYNEMLKDAHKHKFQKLLTYRYDRISRSLRELIFLLETFKALNIDFISIHESVDTATPTGTLMFNIISSFAEFEREVIRERVRSGLAKAKEKGIKIGRPKVSKEIVKGILDLHSEGKSRKEILTKFSVAKSTYHSIIKTNYQALIN